MMTAVSTHLNSETRIRVVDLKYQPDKKCLQIGEDVEDVAIFLGRQEAQRIRSELGKFGLEDELAVFRVALDIVREQKGLPARERAEPDYRWPPCPAPARDRA